MRFVAFLVVVAAAGCAPALPSFEPIAPASSARALVASGARLAFVDGGKLRVISTAGDDELSADAAGAVTNLALGKRALAALDDGAVRLYPYAGGHAIDAGAADVPLAVAALDDGFLWVEALVDGGALRLTLVESDPFGAVRKRTHAVVDEPIAAPAGALTAFGLVVDGDDAVVGIGDAAWRIDRATGAGTAAWRAAPGQRATSLVVDGGALVVAGKAGAKGFVHRGDGDIASPFPLDLLAPSRAAASGPALVGIDGDKIDVAARADGPITGLATLDAEVFVTLENGAYAFQ